MSIETGVPLGAHRAAYGSATDLNVAWHVLTILLTANHAAASPVKVAWHVFG